MTDMNDVSWLDDMEQVRAYLELLGYDPEQVGKDGAAFAKQCSLNAFGRLLEDAAYAGCSDKNPMHLEIAFDTKEELWFIGFYTPDDQALLLADVRETHEHLSSMSAAGLELFIRDKRLRDMAARKVGGTVYG